MDGKGRCIDNIFVERLWRSLKYEEVYLYAYDTVQMARAGIACYFDFFNDERPHKALGYQTELNVGSYRLGQSKQNKAKEATAVESREKE